MGFGLYLSYVWGFFLDHQYLVCTFLGVLLMLEGVLLIQKENVRRTSLLVITAWFWEKSTLQFSSCSRPQFFHLPVILTKELQHQGRHYLNSSGFPLPARDTDAFKGINISWAYTEKLGMKNVINTNIFQTRQRLIPNVSVFRRMLGYITKAVRENK